MILWKSVYIIDIDDVLIALIKFEATLSIEQECLLRIVILELSDCWVLISFFANKELVTLVFDLIIDYRNSFLEDLDCIVKVLLGHIDRLILNLLHYRLIYHSQELFYETSVLCLSLLGQH